MDAIGNYVARYAKSREEEISLDEYLAECKRNPLAYATAAERMLHAIGEAQILETRDDPRLSRLFANKRIKIYPSFCEFFGMEDVVEQVVSYFRHAAQGLEERKQILYLLGPVGGGKSSLAERLKHLMQQVETLLDSCHALANFGVDRYRRPSKKSLAVELSERRAREAYAQAQVNTLWSTLPQRPDKPDGEPEPQRFPPEPQENLLQFIEKNSPLLEPWQREILRLVRKIAQYFYPQRQTQVMNEGWAVFWHHQLLNTLYDDGRLSDGVMLEWLRSHTNVIYQPPVASRAYSGINPYALGFALYTDFRRICEAPTPEDRQWFPDLAGAPWLPTLEHAMRNYKDESFIGQFLSPKVMRDMRLFAIHDDENLADLQVGAIHDEAGYAELRRALSLQYDLGTREPNIQVWSVNLKGDRTLVLRHTPYLNRPLGENTLEVLKHTARLWGFGVRLESVNAAGDVIREWSVAGAGA